MSIQSNPKGEHPADEVSHAPAHCPSCRSRAIVTTSKRIDASAYWRCESCGEVWNVARQRAGTRYRYDRPFGR